MLAITSDNPKEIVVMSVAPGLINSTRQINGKTYKVVSNDTTTLITLEEVPPRHYRLLNVDDRAEYNAAPHVAGLWSELDYWTSQGNAVVIVDESGEIRGGNLLGYDATIEIGITHLQGKE